jgi:hypothetical protein
MASPNPKPAPNKTEGPRGYAHGGAAMRAHATKVRLRLFWKAALAARGKADEAELRRQFIERARSSGLVAAVHAVIHHGEEDVRHVLNWALRGREPWGSKEFSNG